MGFRFYWSEILAAIVGSWLVGASLGVGPESARYWGAVLLAYAVIVGTLHYRRFGAAVRTLGPLRRGLAGAEARLADQPDDPAAAHDVWRHQLEIGDILALAGHHKAALGLYRRILGIAEKLAATEPENPERGRDLARNYTRIAEKILVETMLRQEGSGSETAELVRKAVTMLRPEGPGSEAVDLFRKAVTIMERIEGDYLDDDAWQREHAEALLRLALLDDDRTARLSRSLEIWRRLDAQGKLTIKEKQRLTWLEHGAAHPSDSPRDPVELFWKRP